MLERWSIKVTQLDRRAYILESKVFLAAYAMRKLLEATKVCTALNSKRISLYRFPRSSSRLHALNNHRLEKHFDLEAKEPYSMSVRELINQIIHSFIFAQVINSEEDQTIYGFWVCSDRGVKDGLKVVPLKTYLDLMREFSDDFPSAMQSTWNEKAQRMDTVSWCPNHPRKGGNSDEAI